MKRSLPWLICLSFFLWSQPATEISTYQGWVLWNVGQGQWLTRVEAQTCSHFDLGGEKAPWQSVKNLCQHRTNLIFLSHDDQDHLSFLLSFLRKFPKACIINKPHLRKPSLGKKLLPYFCQEKFPEKWQLIHSPTLQKRNNRNSQVVLAQGVLIPGDSTRSDEKIWAPKLRTSLNKQAAVKVLILGHHGSLTSTSIGLLNATPNLRLALASARAARYGHPHPKVIERLQKRKTPVLSTENWGHIFFQSFN